jgi:hypothetical protein
LTIDRYQGGQLAVRPITSTTPRANSSACFTIRATQPSPLTPGRIAVTGQSSAVSLRPTGLLQAAKLLLTLRMSRRHWRPAAWPASTSFPPARPPTARSTTATTRRGS